MPPPLLLLSAPPLTPLTPTPHPAFMPKWEGLDMYGACSVLYTPVRVSCLRQLTQVSAISRLLRMWKPRLGVRQPVHRPRLLALRPRILVLSASAEPCSHSSHLPDTLVLAQQTPCRPIRIQFSGSGIETGPTRQMCPESKQSISAESTDGTVLPLTGCDPGQVSQPLCASVSASVK